MTCSSTQDYRILLSDVTYVNTNVKSNAYMYVSQRVLFLYS